MPLFRGAKGGATVGLYQNGGYDESMSLRLLSRYELLSVPQDLVRQKRRTIRGNLTACQTDVSDSAGML